MKWAAELLHMRYAFHTDGKHIILGRTIEQSKVANISTAIIRRETSFTDTIQSRFNYVRVFEEKHPVSFVNARVVEIVEDKMSSNFLNANSKATYACLFVSSR